MSNTKLYIPKKIKAGFQNRDDTFNGKLSYIIYYDDKNILRKEKSWESWRSKNIPAEDYNNEPISGFVLHKDVKRYNWSHFSSKRTLIRVFDPRGMEFEITTDNLLFILQHTDCVKRELVGKFAYAWLGPELILLPEQTEEYRLSSEFTKLQAKKFSAKDLIAGRSYKTKQTEDLVYVGRHMWYDLDQYKENSTRLGRKYHIFTKDDGESFILKSSTDFLANENSEEIVQNYAKIVDKFNNNPHSSKIVKFELVPADISFEAKRLYDYSEPTLIRNRYFKKEGNIITDYYLRLVNIRNYNQKHTEYIENGYSYYTYRKLDENTQMYIVDEHTSRYYFDREIYKVNIKSNWFSGTEEKQVGFTKEDILAMGLCDLYVTLENGRRILVKDFGEL
jgi:hypothetical protein